MTRPAPIRTARLLHYVLEDGIRLAVVRCPFCRREHRHVVPADVLPYIDIVRRIPRCTGKRGDYQIPLAPPGEETPDAGTVPALPRRSA